MLNNLITRIQEMCQQRTLTHDRHCAAHSEGLQCCLDKYLDALPREHNH